MLFVEFRFFWFFLAVFAVYWSLRENRTRKIWLLLCSYFFYACWNWKFLFLIMASSALDYLVGTMLAGPIVRASAFLPQLQTIRRFADVDGRGALVLFLTGFIKKACIADAVAPFVDRYFDAPWNFTMPSAWVAVLFYAIQIYCDFSGYTDMAIATAGLLGYQLPVNFRFPYFAANISDFWHRWHISLSSWLRDYLYIPLGGNRGRAWFVYRNIMITMLLGGLWHGGAWTFVIWGGLHGLALVVHRAWTKRKDVLPRVQDMPKHGPPRGPRTIV